MVQLQHIDIAALIAEAGGDPWAINQSLQAGRPAQICDLAEAFNSAGKSTAESAAAFDEARRRFQGSWNREHGENPINDSAEVQRATQSLGAQSQQLPKVGVDLENIAAALAEAQRTAGGDIATLEGNLHKLDDLIGRALDQEKSDHLTADERHALDAFIHDCEQDAIADTRDTLGQLQSIRSGYSDYLQKAQATLAGDGYDPASVRVADAHEAETPDQAERDVKGALGGDKGAASRVNGVLGSITPDQLAGKVPLTAEQASVLSQLQAQEHGMSIDALNAAEQRLGIEKGMIGDSWQLMSNPNLAFPKTPLTPGAKQGSGTVQGSAEQLPDSVQQTLNAPGWMFADQTRTIADIVKDGNPALQRNSQLDQNLLHKGAQIMTQFSWSRNTYDATVEAVFNAAGRDHAAVNWLVNQQGIYDESTDNFLQNITHHQWSDGGDAAGSLFSWTKDAAGPEAQIAGQTAQACAAYLGQNAQDLLNLPGHHTLGQLDPKLVQGFAQGLAPYVSNIAGGNNDLSVFFHTPDSDQSVGNNTFPVAKGIFSVLSTDKNASDIFNGAAMQQIMQDQNQYAQGVAGHVPGAPTADASLEHAATLKALVDSGVSNAVRAEGINQDQQASEAYSRKQSAYGSVVKGLSTVAGVGGKALPPPYDIIGKIGGPAVKFGGDSLEQDIIGAAPTPTVGPQILPDMSEGAAYKQVLDGLAANHVPINGLPPGFVVPVDPGNPNGPQRIATFEELNAGPRRYTAYDYNQALSGAVQGILGNDATSKIEQDTRLQYDGVIKYPHPWEQ